MHKSKLLIILLLTPWIATFAQTAAKPPVHHTVKPVAVRVDPVASAMKAVTAALKPNEDLGATYLFTNGISDQADTTRSKITTVGCVLSYTVTFDENATDKSGAHAISTHVMDLKNAVPIKEVPDPGFYKSGPKLDMAHSQPFYGFLLRFTIPQPTQYDLTGFNAKEPVPEVHESTPKLGTSLYSKTLEDSVHLKDAINNAIQACGGGANVAPPKPVVQATVQPSGPSAKETLEYITSLLEAHGCATHRWHDHIVDSSGTHNDNMSNQGCTTIDQEKSIGCFLKINIARSGYFYDNDPTRNTGKNRLTLSLMDPTSVHQSEADLNHEGDDGDGSLREISIGRMVTVQGNGTVWGPFYVDTPDNADHLINALSHAIELCGGKKPAF